MILTEEEWRALANANPHVDSFTFLDATNGTKPAKGYELVDVPMYSHKTRGLVVERRILQRGQFKEA